MNRAFDVQAVREALDEGVGAMGVELDHAQRANLVDYISLLARWNRAYNLTGLADPREMVLRHLLDSLSILPWVRGERLLDVGSGAGLPGIVLALALPELDCTLLDSASKKTRFLLQAVAELALTNATVVRCRLEQYRPSRRFSTVVSRATMGLAELHAGGARLLAGDGVTLAMKGRSPRDELDSLGVGGAGARIVGLSVPGLEAQRHLVILPAVGG